MHVIPPLGLLYIASIIRNRYKPTECNIKIIDFMAEGLNENSFFEKVLDFSPDIIGFSSLDCEYTQFENLCILAKEAAPNSILLAGGPLASNYHNEIVREELVDFAVIGEGELTTIELLDAIYENKDLSLVRGIAYLKDKEVIATLPREFIQDLDKIPFPAWDLINLKEYSKFWNWNGQLWEKYYAPIMTSRGCVFHCIYCHNLFGKRIRTRSIENVLAEMEMLYKTYGIREFHIIDDIFNFDLARVKEICKGIIERKMKIKISFPNGLRADNMDKETLIWLKKAGTYRINYAIETTNPRLQKFIKKNLNLEKAKKIIEETSERGIITFSYFMLGFPTETIEEMRETISFAVNSKLDAAKFFKVTVFKNTELAKLINKELYPKSLENDESNVYCNQTTNFSDLPTNILNNIILEAHWKFYTKLNRVFRIFFKYNKKFEVLKRLFTLYNAILIEKFADEEVRTEF
jgi:radical SAM superfamily enzyme YgiQ (UPF0313 family)